MTMAREFVNAHNINVEVIDNHLVMEFIDEKKGTLFTFHFTEKNTDMLRDILLFNNWYNSEQSK